MKIAAVSAVSLALAASATPLRIISWNQDSPATPSTPEELALRLSDFHAAQQNGEVGTTDVKPWLRMGKPCGKGRSSGAPGPITMILSKLGITTSSGLRWSHNHDNGHDGVVREKWESPPIISSGMIRILPFEGAVRPSQEVEEVDGSERDEVWRNRGWRIKDTDNEGEMMHHHHHQHHHPHHHEQEEGDGRPGVWRHHGHFRHGHGLRAKLHHLIHQLATPELLAMVFVMGVGFGSIMHMFIMMFILFIRLIRRRRVNGDGNEGRWMSCAERRAMRKAGRADRKAAKAARKAGNGEIRLEGENVVLTSAEEELPRYQEGVENVEVQEKV